jgi:hypothetical protein
MTTKCGGDRLVRIDEGEMEKVALRPVQARDDVRVEIEYADLSNGGQTIPTKGRGGDQPGYPHAPDNPSPGP